MFPRFHRIETPDSSDSEVVGSVNTIKWFDQDWIADLWLGYLFADSEIVFGRWHARENLWVFTPEDASYLVTLRNRSEWNVLDGYWGERAEIVLNQMLEWKRLRFEPSDAIKTRKDGNVLLGEIIESAIESIEVVPEGWDHEHCAICWGTIGRGGSTEGYLSSDENWVCEKCFQDFVTQRSLEFIPRS